jgi:uncharacterized protein (AIM24 family)
MMEEHSKPLATRSLGLAFNQNKPWAIAQGLLLGAWQGQGLVFVSMQQTQHSLIV